MRQRSRLCPHCGLEKALWMFWTNGQGKPGGPCKTCHPQWRRERITAKRRERINAYERARYHASLQLRRRKIAKAVARNRRIRQAAAQESAA